LLNPARPDARLVGVFKPEHVELYPSALEFMKCPRFSVVCGQDAESGRMIGEVSAQGHTLFGSTLRLPGGVHLTSLTRTPRKREHEKLDSLLVRNPDESASRLETILSGEDQGLDRQTLLMNAAVASWTHGTASSLDEGLSQGAEALDSGRALGYSSGGRNFQKKLRFRAEDCRGHREGEEKFGPSGSVNFSGGPGHPRKCLEACPKIH